LNPRRFDFPKDEEDPNDFEQIISVIELPAAPPQPWSEQRPNTPAGRVEQHKVRSTILDNERRVWVYTPPDYTTAGAPFGLLLLFDGWSSIYILSAPTILDNLRAADRLPPLVAIMVDSLDQKTRSRELPCYPPFADFLVQELLPWARQRYHIT